MATKQVQLSVDEIRKNKFFIATPCYGGQLNEPYFRSVIKMMTFFNGHQIPLAFGTIANESLVTRARNVLVAYFLASDYTHLLFIDADIQFNPQDILALLALDKDIIGGPYPKKSINWPNIANAITRNSIVENDKIRLKDGFNPGELDGVTGDFVFNPVPGTKSFRVTEPVEVMEIGTGFMMVKREVFEKYAEEYPHLHYKPDHIGQANFDGSRYIHAYFDTVIDPQSHRYLSEDYMFCQNARAIGMKVWLCPWMKTTHVGTYGFQGDLPAVAALSGNLR